MKIVKSWLKVWRRCVLMSMSLSWDYRSKSYCAVALLMSMAPGSQQAKFLALLWWLTMWDVSSSDIPSQDMTEWSFSARTYPSSHKNTSEVQAFGFHPGLDCSIWEVFPKWLPGKDLCSSLTRSKIHPLFLVVFQLSPAKNGFIMCQEDNFYGSLGFKKHIGCSEKFKKSSDPHQTLKLFPLLVMDWGK